MLLHRKRVGLILRVFSPKSELVSQNVRQIIETVNRALDLVIKGKKVFSRIDVLVSGDSRYGDSDCGETLSALRAWQDAHPADYVAERHEDLFFSEVRRGDIFCGLLNYGVAHQLRDRIDYSMILSSGVKDYLTADNVELMLQALEDGALVTGLALAELAPSILKGRIANTCAMWDNSSLVTVGGFDLRAAKPRLDDRLADYARGWSVEEGEVFYPVAGVEEIIPLIRLVDTFGPCIAPIVPVTGGQWVVSNDPQVLQREKAKLGTKYERQMRWCVAEGVDFSFIEGGVMEKYRQ